MSVAAKFLNCIVDGVEITGTTAIDADDSGTDRLDATTAGHRGYTATDVGCYDLELTVTLLIDTDDGPPVQLQVGTELEEVYIRRYPEESPPNYYLPFATVVSKPQRMEVRGRIEATCRIKNWGPYAEDGTSVP